jgi:alpha-L-glutamate ligase-like protein
MTWSALREIREAGVLGMNRRNAEYILRCNARSRFPTVDDKVLTKTLARHHGIPTPDLLHVIGHHGEIRLFSEALAAHRQFCIKPARGSGGSGIVLIEDRREAGFVTVGGRAVTRDDVAYHLSGILSGIYSLEGLEDRALFETLIHPDPVFSAVTYLGVPDIRIIVYRGVPVMGMVRLPTRDSDGKANLHRGAIGAGIDLSTGRTLTAVHRASVIALHPDTDHPVSGIEVPFWEKMLLVSARATEMTGLGYLGVDLIIDRDRGPLLLEMNARPGLAIQLANRAGLWKRLEAVDQAPARIFFSAESRVRWAMGAFHSGIKGGEG